MLFNQLQKPFEYNGATFNTILVSTKNGKRNVRLNYSLYYYFPFFCYHNMIFYMIMFTVKEMVFPHDSFIF